MGVFEFSNFVKGIIGVCEFIVKLEDVIIIIGGGDFVVVVILLGFEDDFIYIFIGGGVLLEYLEGKELFGIKVINDK